MSTWTTASIMGMDFMQEFVDFGLFLDAPFE